jgi:hypothetical protein
VKLFCLHLASKCAKVVIAKQQKNVFKKADNSSFYVSAGRKVSINVMQK